MKRPYLGAAEEAKRGKGLYQWVSFSNPIYPTGGTSLSLPFFLETDLLNYDIFE